MRNTEIKYCNKTKKYIYSSEAKAVRAVNKYDEIQRAYFCEHCEGFHTTSQTIAQTLADGEISCEEENRLLRQRVDNLVDEIDKLQKNACNCKH